MQAEIKTDDALTAAWWHELQSVKVNPDGNTADPLESVRKAVEHLKASTPSGSIYCIATQSGHQAAPHHHWFRTVEGAACFAVHESLIRHTKGIWYATAAYTDEPELNRYGNPSRSAKNVVGVKSLWVDLDVAKPIPEEYRASITLLNARPDKHEVIAKLSVEQQELVREYLREIDKYTSQEEAVQGLSDFISKTNLTPSRILTSGRGIHAYWHFDDSLTANSWKQLAEGFKALTVAHGLKADPMRTADPASLMRLPGTWHRKGEPLEVKALTVSGIVYSYDALSAAIKERLRITSPSALKNMREKHAPTGVAAALMRPSEFPPANAEIVASKCQQLRFFRQSKGNVDEPVWYLVAGTLGHCTNGEAYFQEWSSGHPQYDYNATQAKMDQWMERATGASSCGAFESKNPTGCAGCPYKGKVAFPVQLGEEAAPLIEEFAIPTQQLAGTDGKVENRVYVPPTSLGNFRRTVNGIQVVDDALPAPITICPHDIWITRNSHDKNSDSRVTTICYTDHFGDTHEHQLKASLLADPKALLTWLYDKGLYINVDHAKIMSTYLQAYINDIAKNQRTITLNSSMGWASERDIDGREKRVSGFVLGNRLITPEGTIEAGLAPKVREFARCYHSVGERDKWVQGTKIYGESGFEARAFAFLASFGAPLMKFSGNLNAGIISLLGSTGAGKTTSALYGLSIYGDTSSTCLKWGDTANAIHNLLGEAKNLPVCIDEMTQISSEAMSQLAYTISSGKPKSRLKTDGTAQTAFRDPWHTICLMTSNESLIEKVKLEKSDPTAALARILEYRIEPDDRWDTFCHTHLTDILTAHHGSIGEEYLSYVVKNREQLAEIIPQMQQWVKQNGSNLGAHRFLDAMVACTLVGAQIAKNMGLIQFELENVTKWVLSLLKEYGTRSRSSVINPVEVLGTFVSENNGKIITVKETNGIVTTIGETPRGIVMARYDIANDKFYVRKESFERWMTNRKINHADVLIQLMSRGYMERGSTPINIVRGVLGAPAVSVHCYVFDAKKLGMSIQDDNFK